MCPVCSDLRVKRHFAGGYTLPRTKVIVIAVEFALPALRALPRLWLDSGTSRLWTTVGLVIPVLNWTPFLIYLGKDYSSALPQSSFRFVFDILNRC